MLNYLKNLFRKTGNQISTAKNGGIGVRIGVNPSMFATAEQQQAAKEKMYEKQGVSKYHFNEGFVWARDLKNALRKAGNKGYTMVGQ